MYIWRGQHFHLTSPHLDSFHTKSDSFNRSIPTNCDSSSLNLALPLIDHGVHDRQNSEKLPLTPSPSCRIITSSLRLCEPANSPAFAFMMQEFLFPSRRLTPHVSSPLYSPHSPSPPMLQATGGALLHHLTLPTPCEQQPYTLSLYLAAREHKSTQSPRPKLRSNDRTIEQRRTGWQRRLCPPSLSATPQRSDNSLVSLKQASRFSVTSSQISPRKRASGPCKTSLKFLKRPTFENEAKWNGNIVDREGNWSEKRSRDATRREAVIKETP